MNAFQFLQSKVYMSKQGSISTRPIGLWVSRDCRNVEYKYTDNNNNRSIPLLDIQDVVEEAGGFQLVLRSGKKHRFKGSDTMMNVVAALLVGSQAWASITQICPGFYLAPLALSLSSSSPLPVDQSIPVDQSTTMERERKQKILRIKNKYKKKRNQGLTSRGHVNVMTTS